MEFNYSHVFNIDSIQSTEVNRFRKILSRWNNVIIHKNNQFF